MKSGPARGARDERVRCDKRGYTVVSHMDTTTNNTKTVARPTQRLRVCAIVALVAFLIGLVPMWLSNRTITRERDDSQQALRLARIENSLAAAAIRARRGEYRTGSSSRQYVLH